MYLLLLTEIAIIFYSITENKPHSDIGCCLAGRTIVVRDYPLAFTQLTWQTRWQLILEGFDDFLRNASILGQHSYGGWLGRVRMKWVVAN